MGGGTGRGGKGANACGQCAKQHGPPYCARCAADAAAACAGRIPQPPRRGAEHRTCVRRAAARHHCAAQGARRAHARTACRSARRSAYPQSHAGARAGAGAQARVRSDRSARRAAQLARGRLTWRSVERDLRYENCSPWAAQVAGADDRLNLFGHQQLHELVGDPCHPVRDVQVADQQHQHPHR